ncbi:hypothetical protein NC651_004989 [Populus alba x Populus x berolinensis]|nr:hypothetical protein NC651_004989 [Populus alba x Populus x berolinensis]
MFTLKKNAWWMIGGFMAFEFFFFFYPFRLIELPKNLSGLNSYGFSQASGSLPTAQD